MAIKANDIFDSFFHAIKVFEGLVATNHFIGEYSAQPRILGGVDHLRLTYGQ